MKLTTYILLAITLLPHSLFASNFESNVQDAVKQQLKIYPKSQLQDIYKNFFQDRFGPGHLIPDTAASGNYLRKELASYNECSGPTIEPTGWEENFYRVNLSVLKENIIPYQLFFDAFVESVNNIKAPSIEEWTTEWNKILSVIDKMNLQLPEYENDKTTIKEMLASGNYVVHHSVTFNSCYQPHYRIIRKDIFDERLNMIPACGNFRK